MRAARIAVVVALAAAFSPVVAVRSHAADVPPGCDADRVAVAHHADQAVLAEQPPTRPIACANYTGFAGSEGKVEVTRTGAVMFVPAGVPTDPTTMGTVCKDVHPEIDGWPPVTAPAPLCDPGPQSIFAPGGIAVSHDDGASWVRVDPMGMTWVNDDNDAFVDPLTGRFFASYISSDPAGQVPADQGQPQPTAITATNPALAQLVTSGDDGQTWQYGQACCEISDEGGFTAGPVPPGDTNAADQLTTTYPHITYYCWQASQDVPPQPPARFCSKSRDGGSSWEPVGFVGRGVVPAHPEVCATPGSIPPSTAFTGGTQPTDEAAGMPQAAPDGTLYVVIACAPDHSSPVQYWLARSTDEAATWTITQQLAHPGELRIDTDGNLYLLRSPDNKHFLLSNSTDGFALERNVLAPQASSFQFEDSALYGGAKNGGWSCCVNWYYDVREPGHVAIAYYGHTATSPSPTSLDGYITETRDAIAADPVFYSAVVNPDSSHPLLFKPGFPQGGGGQQTNSLGVNISVTDGTPWASFVEDCTDCTRVPGVAGRLWWPAA